MLRVTSKNFTIELSDEETKVIDLYVGNNWMHHHNRRPTYADICPLSDLSSKRDRQIVNMSDVQDIRYFYDLYPELLRIATFQTTGFGSVKEEHRRPLIEGLCKIFPVLNDALLTDNNLTFEF